MSTHTFVLIGGAWHPCAFWQRIIPLLEAQGHRAIAPELLGMGTDPTPLSQINLKAWVDQVVEIIEKQNERVILVGHSRGGLIISEVAQRIPEKIQLLVYLAAFLLPSGETVTDNAAKIPRILEVLVAHPDGTATIKSDKIIPVFYNATSPEWAAKATELIAREPGIVFQTPLQLTDDRFGTVPRAYIECTNDNILPIDFQRSMQRRLPCRYVVTMNTDHSPFFSAPTELAKHLVDLAGRE